MSKRKSLEKTLDNETQRQHPPSPEEARSHNDPKSNARAAEQNATPEIKPQLPVSEARLRANRENAKRSTGPRTPEGKRRSSLNATRHGILSHVIHLPEQEMAAYTTFTREYVDSLKPVGAVETQLANACADLQFRLHRIAAAEHNLFALGHEENGAEWNSGHDQSQAALTFAETVRRSSDPIATVTLYEQRINRRFLQTLKQLREMQAERRKLEQQQLEEMYTIASLHPSEVGTIEPDQLGFVCSMRDWRFYLKRQLLLSTAQKGSGNFPGRVDSRKLLRRAA